MATARVRKKRARRKRYCQRRRADERARMPDRVLKELHALPAEPEPEPAERPPTYREGLERMTVAALRALIKEHDLPIKHVARLRKAELVDEIAVAVEARNDF